MPTGLNGHDSPRMPPVVMLEAEPLEATLASSEVLDPPPPPNPLGMRDASSWAGELPPIEYLAPRLHLAPGRPLGLVGYAGAGKTLLAADLALAIAGGPYHRTFWGLEIVGRQGPVAMIDLETGPILMRQRFHRLAIGRGAHIADWGQRLRFCSFPRWNLTSADAEEKLCQTVDGTAAFVIDSLVMACPGVDENSARIADQMGLLARVSEATGSCGIVLHHEGKPPAEGQREAKYRGRGSSAIQGMWGSQWVVSSRDGTLVIEHGKSQWGQIEQPIFVKIADVEMPIDTDDPGAGVRRGVRIERADDAQGAFGQGEEVAAPGALQRAMRAAIDVLRATGPLPYGDLCRSIKSADATRKAAIGRLVEEGRVVRNPSGRKVLMSLIDTETNRNCPPSDDSSGWSGSEE